MFCLLCTARDSASLNIRIVNIKIVNIRNSNCKHQKRQNEKYSVTLCKKQKKYIAYAKFTSNVIKNYSYNLQYVNRYCERNNE